MTADGAKRPVELQHSRHWRLAVWALRAGYAGLAVVVAGLIVRSPGSTPWVLAVGMNMWLIAATVTLVEFFWARRELHEPRPGYLAMRWMLVRDTVHTQPEDQQS